MMQIKIHVTHIVVSDTWKRAHLCEQKWDSSFLEWIKYPVDMLYSHVNYLITKSTIEMVINLMRVPSIIHAL